LNALDFSTWYQSLGAKDKKGQLRTSRHKRIDLKKKYIKESRRLSKQTDQDINKRNPKSMKEVGRNTETLGELQISSHHQRSESPSRKEED